MNDEKKRCEMCLHLNRNKRTEDLMRTFNDIYSKIYNIIILADCDLEREYFNQRGNPNINNTALKSLSNAVNSLRNVLGQMHKKTISGKDYYRR